MPPKMSYVSDFSTSARCSTDLAQGHRDFPLTLYIQVIYMEVFKLRPVTETLHGTMIEI